MSPFGSIALVLEVLWISCFERLLQRRLSHSRVRRNGNRCSPATSLKGVVVEGRVSATVNAAQHFKAARSDRFTWHSRFQLFFPIRRVISAYSPSMNVTKLWPKVPTQRNLLHPIHIRRFTEKRVNIVSPGLCGESP